MFKCVKNLNIMHYLMLHSEGIKFKNVLVEFQTVLVEFQIVLVEIPILNIIVSLNGISICPSRNSNWSFY